MNMELDEDCTMSDWEAVLELDEALAGWLLRGPDRGKWGWEWGWADSDLQDPEWDTEDIPAVSCYPHVSAKQRDKRKRVRKNMWGSLKFCSWNSGKLCPYCMLL